ncbi:MAG: hypothetical protein KME30_23490 [Iphinoe sp. HA4291-MV1]|nr:hypothetical protein [Iphinoe sp. HA4291-MV1]
MDKPLRCGEQRLFLRETLRVRPWRLPLGDAGVPPVVARASPQGEARGVQMDADKYR